MTEVGISGQDTNPAPVQVHQKGATATVITAKVESQEQGCLRQHMLVHCKGDAAQQGHDLSLQERCHWRRRDAYQPAEGSPAEGEAGHEEADGGNHGLCGGRINAGSTGSVGGELRPGVDVGLGQAACGDLCDEHEHACSVEERLAAKPALQQMKSSLRGMSSARADQPTT